MAENRASETTVTLSFLAGFVIQSLVVVASLIKSDSTNIALPIFSAYETCPELISLRDEPRISVPLI